MKILNLVTNKDKVSFGEGNHQTKNGYLFFVLNVKNTKNLLKMKNESNLLGNVKT